MVTINKTAATKDAVQKMGDPLAPPTRPLTRRSDFKRQSAENMTFTAYLESELDSCVTTGAVIGMMVGGVLGMVNATLAVILSPFFIPGFDLLVTQPLDAALVGAALGIILGAVIGSLLGWGVSSKGIERLDSELESNASFYTVQEIDDMQRIQAWRDQHGEYANI